MDILDSQSYAYTEQIKIVLSTFSQRCAPKIWKESERTLFLWSKLFEITDHGFPK